MIHSASTISLINAGLKYPRSVFLIEKWKETTFMKNNNNFKYIMRDFVRSNSFFQKLVFPVAWNVTKTVQRSECQNCQWFVSILILPYNQMRARNKQLFYSHFFIPLIFCKFPLHIAVPQIALLFSIFSVRYWYTCYNISSA